ncbi:MAG: hypothetical protein ACR2HS_04150 [Gammaproteobacteria bacterium]
MLEWYVEVSGHVNLHVSPYKEYPELQAEQLVLEEHAVHSIGHAEQISFTSIKLKSNE